MSKKINGSTNSSEIILATSDINDLDEEYEDKSQNEVVVHLENIHKTYLIGVEGVPAIRGISLDVRRGEWLTIYGTSGGGKTSLLNILGTIDKPSKGELVICGTKINANTKDSVLADLRLKKLGFVFQAFNLLNTMTAKENIEFPMQLLGQLDKAERTAVALVYIESDLKIELITIQINYQVVNNKELQLLEQSQISQIYYFLMNQLVI